MTINSLLHTSQRLRILLIDDDEDDFLLVREMLEEIPHFSGSVEWASTFEEGRKKLLERRHDIYFVDYYLGPERGLDIIREVTEKGIVATMILLTGYEDQQVDALAVEAGAADYLVKGQLSPIMLDRSMRYAMAHMKTLDKVRQSEARFRALIEDSPDAIFVHREQKIFYVNPAAVEYLECNEVEEVIGRSMVEFVHPDDRQKLTCEWESIYPGKSIPAKNIHFLKANGEVATAELLEHGLMFEGEPAIMAIARDKTEQQKLRERMTVSERMASLGTLAAGVAHEINNPLAYVVANVELALQSLSRLSQSAQGFDTRHLVDDLRIMLTDAKDGAERVRHIVRDLRQFARNDDEEIGAVNVEEILDSALGLAHNEVRHRAKVVKNYQENPPVLANESRLGQVFVNLIVNAAQAIPGGAASHNVIGLSTRLDPTGNVVIEVSDTGPGIPPELMARIFDPFFTTKPVGEGMGLGLSICHGIVHAFGGVLSVESQPGKGTTFSVSLPPAHISTPAGEHANQAPQQQAVRSHSEMMNPKRIAVIDDEPLIGDIIRRVLSPNHDVSVFTHGSDALQNVRDGVDYDLIICDLMMPDMTGMELHGELTKIFPSLAESMIFITGGIFTPQAQEFLDSVSNAVLEKPFNLNELKDLVNDHVGL